jgi:hypothetical protein
MVTGNFGGTHSRFIIAAQPLEDEQTLCEGIVFARSIHVPLLDRSREKEMLQMTCD